jgi:hypothetical protein
MTTVLLFHHAQGQTPGFLGFADQLREAVDRQESDRERKMGEILVELGMLPREELESYMRLQIEEAVYYLFTWSTGTFNFEAGRQP